MEKLLRTLVYLVKIFSRKTGEALEARFELPILEQKIVDSKMAAADVLKSIAIQGAEKDALVREVEDIEESIEELIGYLKEAHSKGITDLIQKTAKSIAKKRNKLTRKKAILDQLTVDLDSMEFELGKMNENIEKVDTEATVVKTRAALDDAQDKIDNVFDGAGTSLKGAAGTLASIKERQQKKADVRKNLQRLEKEGTDSELLDEMQSAGIKTSDEISVDDILAELNLDDK